MRHLALVATLVLVLTLHLLGQARGAGPAGAGAQQPGAPGAGAPGRGRPGGGAPGGGIPGGGGPPGGRGGFGGARGGQAGALFDMTGYWVSVVGEDWRWRAFPQKGDYGAVPLNAAARRIADAWDVAKDAASGEECKAYAAPSVMRVPGRLHVTWQDPQTLKIETEAGRQTRLLYFGASPAGQLADWQGISKAEWDLGNAGAGGLFFGGGRGGPQGGSLKVVTTKMRPGYVTRNGVPYGESATLTEYFDLIKEKSGTQYLVLTSMLDDPAYMSQPMWTAVHFRKQADASGWNPVGCGGK